MWDARLARCVAARGTRGRLWPLGPPPLLCGPRPRGGWRPRRGWPCRPPGRPGEACDHPNADLGLLRGVALGGRRPPCVPGGRGHVLRQDCGGARPAGLPSGHRTCALGPSAHLPRILRPSARSGPRTRPRGTHFAAGRWALGRGGRRCTTKPGCKGRICGGTRERRALVSVRKGRPAFLPVWLGLPKWGGTARFLS